jgi:hypothetical protein
VLDGASRGVTVSNWGVAQSSRHQCVGVEELLAGPAEVEYIDV